MKQIMKSHLWISYGIRCVSKREWVGVVQVLDSRRYAACYNGGPIAALTAKIGFRHARKYPPAEYIALSEILGGAGAFEEE